MEREILLFAHLRDVIGRDRIHVALPPGATVRQVLDVLASQHAVIAEMKGRLAVAVNQRYVPLDAELPEGEMALIPPVSGG